MKKSDFKIDFSKRDVISMVCFTVVMILVLILGNSFGYVSAENYRPSDNSLSDFTPYYGFGGAFSTGLNTDDLENTSEYLDTFDSNTPFSYSNPELFQYLSTMKVPTRMRDDWRDYWYEPDYSQYNSFIARPLSNTEFVVYLFNGECSYFFNRVIIKNDGYQHDTTVDKYANSDRYIALTYQINNGECSLVRFNSYVTLGSGSEGLTDLGDGYYAFSFSSNSVFGIPFANFEVYTTKTYFSDYGNVQTQKAFLQGQNDSYAPINYLLLNGNYNGSGGSAENDSNNMYLDSCNFKFTFNNYVSSITDDDMKYTGNWNKGNITFNAILNNYQSENLSNFSLKFKFQMLIRGTGYLPFNNPNVDQLDDGHVFYGNFFVEQTKSLSELSSGSISWNADTLWSIMTDDTASVNGSNISHLSSFLSQVSEYKEIDWSYFKIYATCYLVSDSEGTSDTSRSDSYNFLSGQTTNISDGLGTNYNPYIDSSSGIPSGDDEHFENTSSSITSTGYGTVTQNNNQTVNVNTNYDTSGTIDRLEQILAGEDDSSDDTEDAPEDDSSNEGKLKSYVSKFRDLLQTNNWLVMCNLAFGFIPVEVWTTLATFFLVCISFLTAFCLLRLIFDFL